MASSISKFTTASARRVPVVSSASASFRPTAAIATTTTTTRSYYCHATDPVCMPLKAGTPIPGMDFFKDPNKEPIVALKRSDYPGWVNKLATPLPPLAKLRKIPNEEADDKLKMRFLKLRRRMIIKDNNRSSAKN